MNYAKQLRDIRTMMVEDLKGINHDFTLSVDCGDTQTIRLEAIELENKQDELLQITYTHSGHGESIEAYVLDLLGDGTYLACTPINEPLNEEIFYLVKLEYVELESLAQVVELVKQ